MLDRFADPAGGFFDTADDHERLITRPKDLQDNAMPSGDAMAATVLLRLAALDRRGPLPRGRGTGDRDGRAVPRPVPDRLRAVAVGRDFAVDVVDEVAVVGDPSDAGDPGLLANRSRPRGGRPNQVIAVSRRSGSSAVPLLAGRSTIDGRPTAYVCRGFACRLPVTTEDELAADFDRPVSMPFPA